MINVTVDIDDTAVKRSLGNLANKSGDVIARAANRTITTARKTLRQETSRIYEVRGKDVEQSLKVKKATRSRPEASLTYISSHQNLYQWSSHGRSVVAPRTPVVSSSPFDPDPAVYRAHVMKSHSSGIELGGENKPFVQITRGGNLGLFRRSGRSPYPLKGVAAPAVTQVMKNDDVKEKFIKETSEMLTKRLEHETDVVLKGGI